MDLERILAMYKEVTAEHILELGGIINNEIGISDPNMPKMGESLMNMSAEKIMERWKTGKKYLRTVNVAKAIPNYPEEVLKLSVSVDAIVNNLDDLLDESLDINEKTLYIVEVIKLFSMFNYQSPDQTMRNAIAKYFNKLISVALLEKVYYDMMKSSHNSERPLEHIAPLYDCRSLDIDIFVELPMIRMSADRTAIESVINSGRCFRALNLIKKDIKDFQHDKEQNIATVITIFHGDKERLRSLIDASVRHYLDKSKRVEHEGRFKEAIDNYRIMAENEAIEIRRAMEYLFNIS